MFLKIFEPTKIKVMVGLIKIAVIFIISSISFGASAQSDFSLTVKIQGAVNNKGQMFISVYNKEAQFLSKFYKGTKSKIVDNSCVVTFNNLPSGTYAVSIYHDENDNGRLDSNFLGIPKEDYGCSNDAKGFMGPPKWEDAKFEINNNKTITITL